MNNGVSIIDRILQRRIVSHLLFWGGFLLVFIVLGSLNSGTIWDHLFNYLALLPSQLMASYSLVYYQVPKLFLQKKYLSFSVSFGLSTYLFAAMARLSVIYIAEPFIRENFEQESVIEIISDPLYLFSVYFPGVYMIAFLMLAIKTIKERIEEKGQMEELKKEKVTNELNFLKAQIHPHFLFNTLNNLYALTIAKSDNAPKVVVKLSEMLDYILYQCNSPEIEIRKEVDLIQHYIDLELLRYGETLDLKFDHSITNGETKITPLLLLPLVENAFKHGASQNPVNPVIHIVLKEKGFGITFEVYNSKSTQPVDEEKDRKGIGLSNVRRQLELKYLNKYSLDIQDSENSFKVQLIIRLN